MFVFLLLQAYEMVRKNRMARQRGMNGVLCLWIQSSSLVSRCLIQIALSPFVTGAQLSCLET